MPYRTLLILGRLGILSPICFLFLLQLRPCMQTPLHQQSLILLTWAIDSWLAYFGTVALRFCSLCGQICDDRTSHCFCFCLFSLVLLLTFRDYNSILEYCLCCLSFTWCTHRIIPLDAFSFMDRCLCFVIWCVVLLTWGISSLAYCGLEAWPIIGDIEPISLGSEIWPREFETVTHLFMIRAVPRSLPTPCFVLTYIHPLWAFHSITFETIIWPFRPRLF